MAILPFLITVGATPKSVNAYSAPMAPSRERHLADTPPLPHKLIDMINDKSFVGWLDQSGPTFVADNGKDWPRQCETEFGCGLPWFFKAHAHLTTQAADGTQKLFLNQLPENGVVFARVDFTKGETRRHDKGYKLPTSYDTFYLVVEPAAQGAATYSIVGRKGTDAALIGSKKPFVYCDMNGQMLKEAYSGLRGCKTDHPMVQAALAKLKDVRASGLDTTSALYELWRALGDSDELTDSEAWVTCAHGCCIAQY